MRQKIRLVNVSLVRWSLGLWPFTYNWFKFIDAFGCRVIGIRTPLETIMVSWMRIIGSPNRSSTSKWWEVFFWCYVLVLLDNLTCYQSKLLLMILILFNGSPRLSIWYTCHTCSYLLSVFDFDIDRNSHNLLLIEYTVLR